MSKGTVAPARAEPVSVRQRSLFRYVQRKQGAKKQGKCGQALVHCSALARVPAGCIAGQTILLDSDGSCTSIDSLEMFDELVRYVYQQDVTSSS
jgi:hypothetical protein